MNRNLETIAGALVGAIAGFVVARSTLRSAPDLPLGLGVIFLFGSGASRVAKVFPDPIVAKKNGKIDWFVAEFQPSHETGDITFHWVEHPDNPTLPEKNPLSAAAHDKRAKKVKGKVKGTVKGGEKYRYHVLEGDVALVDPDVEIMQF